MSCRAKRRHATPQLTMIFTTTEEARRHTKRQTRPVLASRENVKRMVEATRQPPRPYHRGGEWSRRTKNQGEIGKGQLSGAALKHRPGSRGSWFCSAALPGAEHFQPARAIGQGACTPRGRIGHQSASVSPHAAQESDARIAAPARKSEASSRAATRQSTPRSGHFLPVRLLR